MSLEDVISCADSGRRAADGSALIKMFRKHKINQRKKKFQR